MNTTLKTKRSLSGIYLRFQNPETQKWENWCFEDLPKENQEIFLSKLNDEALQRTLKILNDTLTFVLEANGLDNSEADFQNGMTRDYYLTKIEITANLINHLAGINDMRHESEIPEIEREQFKKLE